MWSLGEPWRDRIFMFLFLDLLVNNFTVVFQNQTVAPECD
jgi:hypothetical protein